MISIIISSVNPEQLKAVGKNIEETIGVPYEIIAMDNQSGEKGICEVYNEGAKQATFEFLCFMHEDINIKTAGWGKNVINHFDLDQNLGLIGIAGSSYKSSVFSGCFPHICSYGVNFVNIIQTYKYKKETSHLYLSNPGNELIKEVAVLDGVWLCTKRHIWKEFPFDEQTFKGFHCYDIDISLAIGQKYKVAVIFDILLEHYSEGKFEKEWMNETFKLHKKWRDYLPVNKAGYSDKDIHYTEKRSYRYIVLELMKRHYDLKAILNVLRYSSVLKLDPFLYVKLYYYALKSYVFKG
ncbi:Radical SAM domain protein [Arcticibacter svalbardensis MN12-7]|uniref:Radical SAM domain protein n=1 Tax=Arcticibacter svalbardensis MN12-7 TaxID=1150600 RepID=R9GR05_9SPHI|nr:glycosyltransferase [Arcticibacter svalbardensis]EOR93985.1 Radical SAM domain protein [Arcticibacter svalbardensis MN12-7]